MNQKPSDCQRGNLFENQPTSPQSDEIFECLTSAAGVKIERIISTGQATPQGEWYDQEQDEWVVVIAGSARLQIENEAEERKLVAGDWILLPAHCRHRVTWTQAQPATLWLAVHMPPDGKK
tara:strand:- start:80357 stop:80719 length:363 start_codon:yes stop_codon:yes gene_type:complete